MAVDEWEEVAQGFGFHMLRRGFYMSSPFSRKQVIAGDNL